LRTDRWRNTVFCVAAAIAVSCARSGGDPASPASSLALGKDDPAPSPIFVGNESVTADAYVLGVRAATVQVEIQKSSCGPAGGTAIVGWQAKTTGLVALFRDMHVEMTSSIDVRTGKPIDDGSHWVTDPKPRDYAVRFARGSYYYDYRRSDGLAKAESVPVPEGLWAYDPSSAALLLRSYRPAKGDQARFYAVVGRHLWRIDATFRGPEMLPYRGGKRAAVRFEGVVERLTGEPSELVTRSFQLWFSDDPERVPLLAAMGSQWGEVRLELAKYEQRAPSARCAVAAK
jgi:hypothetical protein